MSSNIEPVLYSEVELQYEKGVIAVLASPDLPLSPTDECR